MGLTRQPMEPGDRPRCWWPNGIAGVDPLMVAYHDQEWGEPVSDDRALFERLALEGFQAGLSWATILRKREAFRRAFVDFEPQVVAGFGDLDRERLLADPGIVRNRAKVDATIGNAAQVPGPRCRMRLFRGLSGGQASSPHPYVGTRIGLGGRAGNHAGIRRTVGRLASSRLPIRRLDDRLQLHAKRRLRGRPSARLLPASRLTCARPTRRFRV